MQVIRGDASRIEELRPLWTALREHHASLAPGWALHPVDVGWARRREDYEAILREGGALFLVEDAGEIVGCLICEQERGGSRTWSWPPDVLSVVDLVVLDSHRGAGIGEALLHAAEEEARARGVAALDLMVLGQNMDARRFYERHGFSADLVTYRKPL